MNNLKLIFTSALMLALAACVDDDGNRVESGALSASQFYNSFVIVDDGSDELYAEAQMTKGSPPNQNSDEDFYIDLGGGDSLWLANGDESLYELDFSENLFDEALIQSDKHQRFRSANNVRDEVYFLFIWGFVVEWGTFYSVSYDRPKGEFDEYTISLVRDLGADIYNSSVAMPEAFEIASPSSGSSFDRSADEVEIVWTNISGIENQVQLTASTTCLDGSFDEITDLVASDLGAYTFSAGSLDSDILDGTCSTRITVAKVRFGDINPVFAGGTIQAQQVRRLTLSSLE